MQAINKSDKLLNHYSAMKSFSISNTAKQIKDLLGTLQQPPVILCIGSDRVTGDCVGPLVGHMLSTHGVKATVLGTLRKPVTALNLVKTVSEINSMFAGQKVIAIDSCICEDGDLGRICVHKGCLRPGSADGKRLPAVGDVNITATVAAHVGHLSAVRLGLTYSLAVRITRAVLAALQE